MNLRKEFNTLIFPILRGLPFLLLLLVGTYFVMSKAISYMEPEYQAVASVKIDNKEDGLTDFVLFENESNGAPTGSSAFLTEVEMFKSQLLKNKVFDELDFEVSYYRIGQLRKRELYNERPFTIEYKILDEQIMDRLFYLEYMGKGLFMMYEDEARMVYIKSIKFDKLDRNEDAFEMTIIPNSALLEKKKNVLTKGDVFAFKFNSRAKLLESVDDANFYVKPVDKDIHVVQLYYKHPVPEKAALFVNTLADAYISSDQKNKSTKASKTLQFIDKELSRIKLGLLKAEKKLSSFRRSQGVIDTKQETDALLKKINSFDLQKMGLDLKEVELQNLYEYIVSRQSLSDFSPDFETIKDEILMHTYLKLKDLGLSKTDLLTKYPEGSTEVSAVNAKIKNLEDFTLETIKKKLLNVEDKRKEIYSMIENLNDKFKDFPDKERQLAMLKRDFLLKESTYEYLTKKRTELAIVQSSKLSFHQVIDYAVIPRKTISPNKALWIGGGMMLALLLGMFLSYLFHFLWIGIRSPYEIEEVFETSIMATVDKVRTKSDNPMEAFLNLYTNLNNISMIEKGRIISICSANAKEGKSIITAQMGKLLASFGVKVLLIDMNMKSPSLHQFFKMENTEGVDHILSQDKKAQTLIRTNGIKNLSLITAGAKNESSSTMVFSPKTRNFLNNMREKYDVVLIDTAAINQRLDAAAIMRLCDANLYVFRKGKSKKRKLEQAQKFIKSYHVPNVYLVFNQG